MNVQPITIDGQNYDFIPPLIREAGTAVEVNIRMPDGRAMVCQRCLVTGRVIEYRPECQVVEDGDRRVVVAAPESIERPKLSWKIRLLRWLAKG